MRRLSVPSLSVLTASLEVCGMRGLDGISTCVVTALILLPRVLPEVSGRVCLSRAGVLDRGRMLVPRYRAFRISSVRHVRQEDVLVVSAARRLPLNHRPDAKLFGPHLVLFGCGTLRVSDARWLPALARGQHLLGFLRGTMSYEVLLRKALPAPRSGRLALSRDPACRD